MTPEQRAILLDEAAAAQRDAAALADGGPFVTWGGTTRALDLLEDGIAAHRLTRLLVKDKILDGPRDLILEHLDGGGPTARKAAEGLRCYWCTGMHAATVVVCLRALNPRWWPLLRRALAVATVVGIVSDLLDP